jgi:hypothetical protein
MSLDGGGFPPSETLSAVSQCAVAARPPERLQHGEVEAGNAAIIQSVGAWRDPASFVDGSNAENRIWSRRVVAPRSQPNALNEGVPAA